MIAVAHPESRTEIVTTLTSKLAEHEDVEGGWIVNAAMVDALVELKAVESAAVIEAAFAADVVDESLSGGWLSARFRIGLGGEPEGHDIRPHWRLYFQPNKPPKPTKRPDPKTLLKKAKSRKGR